MCIRDRVYPSNFMSICLAKDVREVKKSSLATSASGIWLSIYALSLIHI